MQRGDEVFLALACDAAAPFVSANVSVRHGARPRFLYLRRKPNPHEFVMLRRERL
jgi:hypothetical protein